MQGTTAGLAPRARRSASAGRPESRDRVEVAAMVGKILYWAVVIAISLAFVIGLILFLESRDDSSVEGARAPSGLAVLTP
jgi:hypothetical protein